MMPWGIVETRKRLREEMACGIEHLLFVQSAAGRHNIVLVPGEGETRTALAIRHVTENLPGSSRYFLPV